MAHFDLMIHFNNYAENLFFNEKSYSELLLDITTFSAKLESLTNAQVIGLKIKSPYYAMVALLTLAAKRQLAVLISPLESEAMISKLKDQIHFDFTIEDSHFLNLNPGNRPLPNLQIDFEIPSIVVFSSGTTSTPKGIALSFKNIYFSALGFAEFFNQKSHEVSLINLPHHHVGGLMTLWRAFLSGGQVTTDIHYPVDFISLVPIQLKRLLEDKSKYDYLKKIRVILVGGAKLSDSLKEMARGLNLFETYGMSETTSLVMINGEVLPYRKLKLDESGHLMIAGETLGIGTYINNQLKTFENDWFTTNDLGSVDQQGKYHFIERSDLVFISGGENINPLLIEEVARSHPKIKDAYLVAIPDELWGESGVLLYESNLEESIEQELKDYLKENLHPHFVPKWFIATSLEFKSQIKPRRSELKKLGYELYLKSIFSYQYKKNADPAAPLLVVFHGFLGGKEDLLEVTDALSSQYSLLAIDMPGHGATRIKNFHHLRDALVKLSNFIQLFTETPIYYGYSMGGRIALQLALHYLAPAMLILESAGLGLSNEQDQEQRFKADQKLFDNTRQENLQHFLQTWYSTPMFKPYFEHARFQKDCLSKSGHDLREWGQSQNFFSIGLFPLARQVLEDLKEVHFPVVYLYGQRDEKYAQVAKELTQGLPKHLKTREIIGAGHNPHRTHPTETASFLNSLLKY